MRWTLLILSLGACGGRPFVEPKPEMASDETIQATAARLGVSEAFARTLYVHAIDGCLGPLTPIPEEVCAADRGDYGRSPENPLEWGNAAGGNQMGFGRLICPNGATAVVSRNGNIGVVKYGSSSPASDTYSFGDEPTDILDEWTLICPDQEPELLYSNMYRCGDPCPPQGLRLMQADARRAMAECSIALDAGDVEGAMTQALRAVELEPDVDVSWMYLGIAQTMGGDDPGALISMERALSIDPSATTPRLYAALAAEATKDWDKAELHARTFLEAVDGESEVQAEMQCVRALALEQLGDPSAVDSKKRSACEAGVARCCD
ncbi:MAG: hypothetical protein H6741_30580 [Alphaproteobacteria bacterium]|nr:hypothetical protein [Alphaproteobacteria bacterium]